MPGSSPCFGLLMIWLTGTGALSPDPEISSEVGEAREVAIQSRRFDPPVTTLKVGRPVRLGFRNHDSELHAVVPQQLLIGVNVAVSGNGAPEFGEHGLRRVLIPADGHAEIRFTPPRTGTYPYICDMPGHEMQATIEVVE